MFLPLCSVWNCTNFSLSLLFWWGGGGCVLFLIFFIEFHPKLIGLTGSIEDIVSVTKAYRVYFSKPAEDEGDDVRITKRVFCVCNVFEESHLSGLYVFIVLELSIFISHFLSLPPGLPRGSLNHHVLDGSRW